jgi:GT2 family glycosyltransferase
MATPFTMLSLLDSPALQRRAAEIWVGKECSPRQKLPPIAPYAAHDRIRIGYFSADFRNHALAALAGELFETHDRSRFEITAFSLGSDPPDEFRVRAEAAFERFLSVGGLPDHEVAALARRLEIDIAIDLGGYTRHARPRIMALRAAPIQVSWLGYLGTLGGDFIDYLLADPVIVPLQQRQHYAEKIAYLPSYQPNDSKRAIAERTFTRAELGLPAEGFVFCCLNASYKITPETFGSWMRILTATPGSVLLLLGGNPSAEGNLRRHAADRGIPADRLIFTGRLPFGEYLARYRAADLFLDTLPYNAGTTASDALWAGLPVITCLGEAFASRVAASVLTAAGLPELIAADRDAYERLAIALATQPAQLAAIKAKLASSKSHAALFDTPALAKSLERLYERMYDRNRAGLPPEHLLPEDGEAVATHAARAADATHAPSAAHSAASVRRPNIARLIIAVGWDSPALRLCIESDWYRKNNPDIASTPDLYQHWIAQGANEGRLPCEDPLSLLDELMQERLSRPAAEAPTATAAATATATRAAATAPSASAIQGRGPIAASATPEKIRVVCATRKDREEFYSATALGKSLSLYRPPAVELRLFAGNTQGLSTVYNTAIAESAGEQEILLFVHDDLHLCDFHWADRLRDGLATFDIVGLAGNRRRVPGQPGWGMTDERLSGDQRENFSGIVGHGRGFPADSVDVFGPPGQRVALLDGLFLAVHSGTLQSKSLRFDERFDFHFYDLDFCREAERAGLAMGTWPIAVVHESKGGYVSDGWRRGYEVYLEKWGD